MRRAAAFTAAALLALSSVAVQPLQAIGTDATPVNDDLASALEVASASFDDQPDMASATLEDGESQACLSAEQTATVWYWLSVPVDSDLVVEIEGDQDAVVSGVFGPFETLPAAVTDSALAEAAACVYGVGVDQALTQWATAGLYLVRLASTPTFTTAPAIHIDHLVAGDPPSNDDLASATEVGAREYDDSPDLTWATVEPDETDACRGDLAHTAWYWFEAPVASGIRIELTGDEDQVSAGVFGPFETLPSDASDSGLSDGMCVGAGPLTETVDPGLYLVRLASSGNGGTTPAIHIGHMLAYYQIGDIAVDTATMRSDGTLAFTGTAPCYFQHWPDTDWGTLPLAPWNPTEDGGFFSYEVQSPVVQAFGDGTRTVIGDADGYIDCSNADDEGRSTWQMWTTRDDGRFSPKATDIDVMIGLNVCAAECEFQVVGDSGSVTVHVRAGR